MAANRFDQAQNLSFRPRQSMYTPEQFIGLPLDYIAGSLRKDQADIDTKTVASKGAIDKLEADGIEEIEAFGHKYNVSDRKDARDRIGAYSSEYQKLLEDFNTAPTKEKLTKITKLGVMAQNDELLKVTKDNRKHLEDLMKKRQEAKFDYQKTDFDRELLDYVQKGGYKHGLYTNTPNLGSEFDQNKFFNELGNSVKTMPEVFLDKAGKETNMKITGVDNPIIDRTTGLVTVRSRKADEITSKRLSNLFMTSTATDPSYNTYLDARVEYEIRNKFPNLDFNSEEAKEVFTKLRENFINNDRATFVQKFVRKEYDDNIQMTKVSTNSEIDLQVGQLNELKNKERVVSGDSPVEKTVINFEDAQGKINSTDKTDKRLATEYVQRYNSLKTDRRWLSTTGVYKDAEGIVNNALKTTFAEYNLPQLREVLLQYTLGETNETALKGQLEKLQVNPTKIPGYLEVLSGNTDIPKIRSEVNRVVENKTNEMMIHTDDRYVTPATEGSLISNTMKAFLTQKAHKEGIDLKGNPIVSVNKYGKITISGVGTKNKNETKIERVITPETHPDDFKSLLAHVVEEVTAGIDTRKKQITDYSNVSRHDALSIVSPAIAETAVPGYTNYVHKLNGSTTTSAPINIGGQVWLYQKQYNGNNQLEYSLKNTTTNEAISLDATNNPERNLANAISAIVILTNPENATKILETTYGSNVSTPKDDKLKRHISYIEKL